MTLANKSIEVISETDLAYLTDVGVTEGIMIEYKRDMYGCTSDDKKEFLKDIVSFANTAGGHLIIGMDEQGGVATNITPIQNTDTDKELQRLESLVREGIEPRVTGVQMKAVPVAKGGCAFVIRVPKSWMPPHRVRLQNSNRFYARTSAGAYELSVEELRSLVLRGATVGERIRAFRAERLARIDAGRGVVPLATGLGRLVVHIVPFESVAWVLKSTCRVPAAYITN
jgi:Putative DNA-binding domain